MSLSALNIARKIFPGISHINKFGRGTDFDAGVETDVWDRSNAVDGQKVWTAPTAARIHDIVSSDAGDVAAGAGARTVRIVGLKSWDAAGEVTEDLTMNGLTDVPTVNAYVIIYRIGVLTKGATSINIGAITATAQVDGTVTAQINAGVGRTQMAICGVPSKQTFYISRLYAGLNKPAANASADIRLRINPEPDAELTNFAVRHFFSLDRAGTSQFSLTYVTPKIIPGPALIKLTADCDVNNADVSGGFDSYVVDKSLDE